MVQHWIKCLLTLRNRTTKMQSAVRKGLAGLDCLGMEKQTRYIRLWLWAGIALVSAMVVIGGITRLTGSGLSIVEWKLISGILPPLNAEQWQVSFDAYKQFPQYQKVNQSITLSDFKQIYFWEYMHRLLGRIIGVLFLFPFTFFYYKGWLTRPVRIKLMVIFLLGALQGFIGWYMVKSGLIDIPHVSHFRLALHQSLAVLLVAFILWTVLSLERTESQTNPRFTVNMLAPIACLALLFFQMVLGAFVAGLKAGFSYTNFPLMEDSFFPPMEVVKSTPVLFNGVVLQFLHRWLAFVVVISFFVLGYFSKAVPEVQRYIRMLIILGILQLLLGIATLMLRVPVVLGVAHQFLAILILMVIVAILYKFSNQVFER